jgi:hypothetical protein
MRLLGFVLAATLPLSAQWTTVGGNAQHTGLSTVASQPLTVKKWSTKLDKTRPDDSTDEIFAHFGTPIITPANTVFVPVKTALGSYQVEVHSGGTGAILRTFDTAWTPPSSIWTPSFAPGLTARNRFYFPGPGGTVYYLDSPDTNPGPPTQLAFYGLATYQGNTSAFNSAIQISTPIVSDRYGDIFFGFIASSNPAGVTSGIARISYAGVGSWVDAAAAANLTPTESSQLPVSQVPINAAPALSNDSTVLYFSAGGGFFAGGYLVSVNSATLAPIHHVALIDPLAGVPAQLPDISSASPVVAPDGDVFYGVLEKNCPNTPDPPNPTPPCPNHDRGWMLHFSSDLLTQKITGAFGWDDTPSIVPYSLVPSYHGSSSYLIFSKYNNYADAQAGGDGLNKVAVLDPNVSATDPVTGVQVMAEVMTILGPTPGPPAGVREWCINNAAIDKVKRSAIVNSEDGILYRWDFTTNTFTEQITLTAGIGEAYTPTVIGPDGTVYAINDNLLFAVGHP